METVKWGLQVDTDYNRDRRPLKVHWETILPAVALKRQLGLSNTRLFPHHLMHPLSSRSWYWKIYGRVESLHDLHCEFNFIHYIQLKIKIERRITYTQNILKCKNIICIHTEKERERFWIYNFFILNMFCVVSLLSFHLYFISINFYFL